MQHTFEESKHDEIIRLNTKHGWYEGNAMASAELPRDLLKPRHNPGPEIPSQEDEVAAYRKGYAEGLEAKKAGMEGTDNPYSHDNVVRRMASEQGIDPATLK
jgi:hypothetical protein